MDVLKSVLDAKIAMFLVLMKVIKKIQGKSIKQNLSIFLCKKIKIKPIKFRIFLKFGCALVAIFLLKEADSWRKEVWEMIKIRKNCTFYFLYQTHYEIYGVYPR